MGIFRTNDPTQFDDIDGIIVDETAPAASISGVAANIAILVGQFERGPVEELTEVTSIGEFREIYGADKTQSGNQQLVNKKFGRLKVIRAAASDSVKATLTLNASATPTIKFDAKYEGVYGNSLTVEVATPAEGSGVNYIIKDTNSTAVVPVEIFNNIEIANVDASTFSGSALVDVTVLDTGSDPDVAAAANLATGSDGTIVDTDYEDAIAVAEQEKAGNILFLDEYNATRNGYLKVHAANTQDKMVIVVSPSGTDRAAVITDVVNNRDVDGRIIHAWPYANTVIDGAITLTSPASWYASVVSQISPHVAPSKSENARFLGGITSLEYNESRNGFIALDAAGVSALERDPDVGTLIKNAVTTQIQNSSKRTVVRRRMADFLTDSIAFFLKNYQNDVNSKDRRDEVKAQILDFDTRLVNDKILPGVQDVTGGAPLLVDTDSLNTDSVIAQGQFRILYKRRIFSSMRYIVLQAEIGESVVVTEV